MNEIRALYADEQGNILDAPPGFKALARTGVDIVELTPDDLIPLPESADLMYLPDRLPLAKYGEETMPIMGNAVAAILPAGYTRLYLPAFTTEENAAVLPLYGYTAVVSYNDELYVAALYTDENEKWDPKNYNTRNLHKLVKRVHKDLPHNRLVEHLGNCSLNWHCCTAQNMFYRRWEAGIPSSPVCNAKCLGCISLQESECCPSPQSRIEFKPTPKEIAEIGLYHLTTAPEAIISFGQGCEGEPSLAADRLCPAIEKIRKHTSKGQININTNAGYTEGIKRLVDAGLDSMRVSIISALEANYQAYYRSSYTLENVKESIRYAHEHGVHISLNMLYFPGFNDSETETAAWQQFLQENHVDMIQIRNLNLDPDMFCEIIPEFSHPLGTKVFFTKLREACPTVAIGSFSHYQKGE